MADRYAGFQALAAAEPAAGYAITAWTRAACCIVAAPHGGRIEPGTSEIAKAIAGDDLSLYLFEGRKPTGNRDLHITSHRFDEPQGTRLFARSDLVLTIHGVAGMQKVAYVGGRDRQTGDAILRALQRVGFRAARHTSVGLQGLHVRNICNLGRRRAGVQLELSRGLRHDLVATLLNRNAKRANQASLVNLEDFAQAIRSVILCQTPAARVRRTARSRAKG